MLTVITWNQDSKQLHQCSRERSRLVREVITKKWLPIFEQQHVAISTECPFHLDRDYLWWPNDLKEGDDDDDDPHWTCPFCGLDFFCAESLTLHWDNVHRDDHEYRYRDDLVCLADYCDIFRCDVLIRKRQQQKRHQNLMGYLSFGQEESAKCEPAKMALLERSCHNVVRQCTGSLEANESGQQFALVEQELIGSLCSFLTCDHYNDDLFVEDKTSRKVPITLFTVLGAIMACGFCICYYFISSFVQRGFVRFGEKLPIESNSNNSSNSSSKPAESNKSLKLSFRETPRPAKGSIAGHTKAGNFFNNIFEFSQEHKEDTIEFNNEFNANNTADYERKLRAISSIIEEEDEEKDESERDLSYNSYPIIQRKYMVKQRSFEVSRPGLAEHSATRSSHGNLISTTTPPAMASEGKTTQRKRPQSQEIYLHDLPMKVHPKYIQPLKHSYSDRYPCYSGNSAELVSALTKSRSYSHSQLRNAHHNNNSMRPVSSRSKMPPPRQDSIEEEWEQKSQHSHSSMSIQSSMSAPKMATKFELRHSSLSNSAVHPGSSSSREEHHPPYQSHPYQQHQVYQSYRPYHHHQQPQQHFVASSQSNSSIASSRASRMSNHSSFVKR